MGVLMYSSYELWLNKQGPTLIEGGGCLWRNYRRALLSARATVFHPNISTCEAKKLLRSSGALFMRYTKLSDGREGPWWWVVCDSYDLNRLPSKIRNQVNRGRRNCVVRQVDAIWLSEHGYECYFSAHQRYKYTSLLSRVDFQAVLLKKTTGPFEFWAIFVGDSLAGYIECIIENDQVTTNIAKFDPKYFKMYTSYALISHIQEYYVQIRKMVLDNGNRSISHDTLFQELLIKLGYRKVYGNLIIVYKPIFGAAVNLLYPIRGLFMKFGKFDPFPQLRSILFQEQIHRICRSVYKG